MAGENLLRLPPNLQLYYHDTSIREDGISKPGMQRVRYCIRAILLIVALVMILSPAFASDGSQTTVITSPACASENALKDLTISSAAAVFAAGLIAGFNPCLLAMLAFLASSMLASTGRRRDILTMVAFFSLGTFVVYIIFGVGLFSVLQEKSTAAMFRICSGSHPVGFGANAAVGCQEAA